MPLLADAIHDLICFAGQEEYSMFSAAVFKKTPVAKAGVMAKPQGLQRKMPFEAGRGTRCVRRYQGSFG